MTTYVNREMTGIVRKSGPDGLRVVSGKMSWPVRRLWKGGFSLSAGARIRGFVEIYDGDAHLFSCLAYATAIEDGEQLFKIKRQSLYLAAAPTDFAREGGVPCGALAAFEASRIGL